VCRGRRQEERVTESDKEKEHEGERRGSFSDTAEFVLRAEQLRSQTGRLISL